MELNPILSLLCRFLRWLPPNIRGRSRMARWALSRVQKSCGRESSPVVIPLRFGLSMQVDRHDFMGSRIFVYGDYEPGTALVFKTILRPGDGVLDVGANVGYFTLLASCLVGSEGVVHAFEPAPPVADCLEQNVRRNRLANVIVHRLAVSHTTMDVPFYLASSEHRGISSMRDLGRQNAVGITVQAVAVDSMLERLPPIALVKMDIEGAEFLALQGMSHLLQRDRPYLILEVVDSFVRMVAGKAEMIEAFLRERSYFLFRIRTDRVVPLESFPEGKFYLLAVPKERPFPDGLPVQALAASPATPGGVFREEAGVGDQ